MYMFVCPSRIYNVREADAGRYICTASSSAGTERDYAVLHVSGKIKKRNTVSLLIEQPS